MMNILKNGWCVQTQLENNFNTFDGMILAQLFTTQLTALYRKPLENIVGKGENAGNQHFLLFPQCFLPFPKQIPISQSHLYCRLQMLSIWTSLKFHHLEKS